MLAIKHRGFPLVQPRPPRPIESDRPEVVADGEPWQVQFQRFRTARLERTAMNLHQEYLKAVTRRHFFGQTGVGLGAVALASMLQRDGVAAGPLTKGVNPLAPIRPQLPAKAKHVIYLHMAGSPTQLDLFDYKPTLQKYNGKPCPQEYLEGKRFAFIKGVPNMLGTPFSFAKHGKSGAELSEVWKFLPEVVDDIAIVKSMQTEQFNHAPAQLFLHTGTNLFGGASLGSWTTYGLGSDNEDLPGFVVLTSGGKTPDAGKSAWGSGFLPSIYSVPANTFRRSCRSRCSRSTGR